MEKKWTILAKLNLVRRVIFLSICVVGVVWFGKYLHQYFTMQTPANATVDLTDLPTNTMFMKVRFTGKDPIQMPLGANVDELVQYDESDSSLSLAFFKRDPAKPGVLAFEKSASYSAKDFWGSGGYISLGSISLENRTFTFHPQKDHGSPWVAALMLSFGVFVCVLAGGLIWWHDEQGQYHEPCAA
jgi:hypothetical protein